MGRLLYFVLILTIFLTSFFLYSSLFYPLLNSDNAVTVLMIPDFKLPNDLYFWGQDRLGSIIPLIGQLFYKIFNLSALTSESITHYLILLLGFLSFASFLKSKWYKIIFAIIWFFPPMHLIDVTQFAFGIHYSLFAIACYLLNEISKNFVKEKIRLNYILMLTLTLVLIATVWASDMALISITILLSVHAFFYLKEYRSLKSVFYNKGIYFIIVGVSIGYIFIHYAKSISANQKNYSTISDFYGIKQTIKIFIESITDLLLFKANEPFTSVYTYLVLILLGISFPIFARIKFTKERNKWFSIFFFDALVLFTIILISSWTLENNVPRRYFTCTYIALSFALLIALDNISLKQSVKQILNYFILITVLIGGIGTIYNLKYISPKSLTPTVQIVGEFQKLGNIGIIGDYWNSYLISCVDPLNIKATPHEFSYAVRNHELVEQVFKQEKIYLIRDMWMEKFPDTLSQFGRKLVKKGDEFMIGGCFTNEYRIVK